MAIPLGFLTRYAIPLIVATIYLGDVDIVQQMTIFDKTSRLADEALSQARGEGVGDESFDYIIVGGGSAGSLLANRLSASGQNSVLLLEAGGDPNVILEIPYSLGLSYSYANNWQYRTTKQERACLRSDGICTEPKGKGLGGTSNINGMVYNRCKPKDYDKWADFTGDNSWSWDNVHSTFNSFEDYHGYYEESNGRNHGEGGELFVGHVDYLPGIEVFEEAMQEKGYEQGDFSGGVEFTRGFSRIDFNIKNGLRYSAFQAFLEPILNRTNLVIYRHAYATKIEMAEGVEGLRATGVNYVRHGVNRVARANKEVIVSGGAVESPKLLMLSGIGPKEHLDQVGVETLIDLPVGRNMQEHPGMTVLGQTGGFLVNTSFASDYNTTDDVLEYIERQTGPLSAGAFNNEGSISNPMMIGYINSGPNTDLAWPDLRVAIYQKYFPGNDRQEFYFSLELSRLDTTGSITLASGDYEDMPVMDPNFFADLNDIDRMVDGIEIMRDMFLETDAFKKIGIQDQERYNFCTEFEYNTRDYWRCVVMETSVSYLHPTATCRMGPNSSVAVLDSKLKVFGTENLRVIDGSSIPFVPTGNTNLPIMLVAARATEIINEGL